MGGVLCTLAAWGWLFASFGCSMLWLDCAGDKGLSEGLAPNAGVSWASIITATTAACLLEAATTQLDNIFVPLQFFALLCAAAAR